MLRSINVTKDIKEYLQLRIKEASVKLDIVTKIIEHSVTKGNTAEQVLRDLITSFVPTSFNVSTGFIVKDQQVSRQVDVLVFDHHKSVPLYYDKQFAVVTQDMPSLVVESKMQLNKASFRDAIDNICSVKRLNHEITGIIWGYSGLTFKILKNHLLTFGDDIVHKHMPDCIFNFDRGFVVVKLSPDGDDNYKWALLEEKTDLAKILIQRILYSTDVENLKPYIAEIEIPMDVKF